MADCRALAERVAAWGGAVVPARVVSDGDGGWHKGSIRGWPARASSRPEEWEPGWFSWGGDWWCALCPRAGGLVAVDLDGPDAVDEFRKVADALWDRWCLSYKTPGHGGGMHLVWRWPADLPPFSRKVVTLESGGQIDLRGEGTFLLLLGAPRPDLEVGAYHLVSASEGARPPPPLPAGTTAWMESLGGVALEAAPSLGARQLEPEALAGLAARQGGRIKTDRHTALFRTASWLRVRHGFRTFETLSAELGRLVEAYFDTEGEEEHWAQEVVRVARNASRYTEERDRAQAEAAQASLAALRGRPRR